MASGEKMNPDSDDEVDLEALRLAALQTLHAKPKFTPHVNHSNLIPIVPVNVVAPIIIAPTAIKLEPISPTLEENIQVNSRSDSPTKDDEDKDSLETESDQENEDILSMDDKEEEDSLERLMDQLEAEISGKAPIPSNRTVIAPKKSLNELKGNHRKSKKSKKKDVEVELVEVKIGKQQGPVINIRESATPEPVTNPGNPGSPTTSKSPKRDLRTPRKSRSSSPFRRSKSFKRSTSPYWSKSPRRSRSRRRSRSPFWLFRRSKSPLRKSRSPYRRSKSPLGRRRSPFRYSSRTRSRSFERRSRSPWSYSPRRRSRSPHFRDSFSPFPRRRNISPDSKSRKRSSISPYAKTRSPRPRSRSPRRYPRRNSPFRSKSPFRRSRSPLRNKSPYRRIKSPYRRSLSPFSRRTKSPINTSDSPQKRRSPLACTRPIRRSKSLSRRSLSPTRRQKSPTQYVKSPARSLEDSSKSPSKRNDVVRRTPRRSLSKSKRSRSFSTSPRRRNRSPLRGIEKNSLDDGDKFENTVDKRRIDKRPRSLSKDRRNENYRRHDRRGYRTRGSRRYSPSRGRRSPDRQRKRSRSPKKIDEKGKETETQKIQAEDKGTSPVACVPLDPVLEARKKKFESLSEVDPTVDKKISLKSIKESTDNAPADDDDDALNINLESDLWEDSEESENEHESRFKTGEAKVKTNRTVLSFRSLSDDNSKKLILNKPLIEDNRRDKYNNRFDRWQRGRRGGSDRTERNHRKRYRDEDVSGKGRNESERSSRDNKKLDSMKTKPQCGDVGGGGREAQANKKIGRKPIVFASPKNDADPKENEVSTTSSVLNNNNMSDTKAGDREVVSADRLTNKQDKSKVDTDDFDKLISDFEKELESDICLTAEDPPKKVSNNDQGGAGKRLRISVKKDLNKERPDLLKKPASAPTPRSNDMSSLKERGNRLDDARRVPNYQDDLEVREVDEGKANEPEDYVDDDDFALDENIAKRRGKTSPEEENNQNDLRDILSRRRNERLTKAVSIQENMPTRLVQSAFQGLGNRKSKRSVKETQAVGEVPTGERSLKIAGTEGRRVLLLQRKIPDVPSFKVTVPEVTPDTTMHQRLSSARSEERKRSRKLQKHLDVMDEVDQEDEDTSFEQQEKQPRRVRLKRNVTLSSQVQN